MSEFDFDHVYEVCPHCEEEVMLEPEMKVQTCPNCGKRIVPCAMCRACETTENYCTHCCLCYEADLQNKEREEELLHQFGEVRCDYFDEYSGVWCVDAWKTADGDEEGEVVAKINPETFEVTYTKPDYAKDEQVHEVVRWRLHLIMENGK